MNKANFASVWVLALAAAVGVGCGSNTNRTATTDTGDTAARTAGETGRAMNDTGITTKVKAKLASESRLASLTDVNVETENGVVTLKGTAPSEAQKNEAEQVARTVEGVTSVRNEIKVEKDTAAKSTSGRRARSADRADQSER